VLNPVNSTMIATALSPIGREFGVGAGATAWLVSVMYLASAIGQPVAGRLADQFGPRRVFLTGGLLVAVAGVVGALGPTFGWLVAGARWSGWARVRSTRRRSPWSGSRQIGSACRRRPASWWTRWGGGPSSRSTRLSASS
jgi:MFS family permease